MPRFHYEDELAVWGMKQPRRILRRQQCWQRVMGMEVQEAIDWLVEVK